MRAKEFIVERSFPTRKSDVMKTTYAFDTMPSSDPYNIYRFGMAMADHTINYAEGPAAQSAVIVAYTDADDEIIKGGSRQTGHKGRLIADKESHEPNSTNTTSPVAKPKRNKYGV
jgi:hypothetical protein